VGAREPTNAGVRRTRLTRGVRIGLARSFDWLGGQCDGPMDSSASVMNSVCVYIYNERKRQFPHFLATIIGQSVATTLDAFFFGCEVKMQEIVHQANRYWPTSSGSKGYIHYMLVIPTCWPQFIWMARV
jgi:hypothetical protein